MGEDPTPIIICWDEILIRGARLAKILICPELWESHQGGSPKQIRLP